MVLKKSAFEIEFQPREVDNQENTLYQYAIFWFSNCLW